MKSYMIKLVRPNKKKEMMMKLKKSQNASIFFLDLNPKYFSENFCSSMQGLSSFHMNATIFSVLTLIRKEINFHPFI